MFLPKPQQHRTPTSSGSMNLAVTFIIALVFWFLDSACGDAAVSCVLLETCVLPCRFEPGPDPVIHWTKEPFDKTPVHIYYKGRSQLHIQNQNFTGRTSLFEKELSTGNASLRLSRVKVQDEGKYKCYANGVNKPNTDSYVDVFVSAPAPVSLQQQGQELLCRSEGVYPKPSVSWSPPSLGPEPQTSVNVSEDGLYSVSSSLSVPATSASNYTCNISTLNWWRANTTRAQSNYKRAVVFAVEEGGSNLDYLWILILIPVFIFIFIYSIYKKIIQIITDMLQKVLQSGTPSHTNGLDVGEPLNNDVTASSQHANGHRHGNGLNHAYISVPTEAETSL